MPRRLGISQRRHWRAVGADFALALSQIALLVTLLAHQAWLMTDAIARTIFRLLVSRRRLLEWVTAAQAKISDPARSRRSYWWMAGGVALAAAAGVIVVWVEPGSWPIASPFVILWALSPAVARWVSLAPPVGGPNPVSGADARTLRLIARRTWRFFETFVTADDHMLPPDNFQEEPKPVLAHRTSPTNLGLYLLSVVAARDFGWLGTIETADRLDATLATMSRLERFRGHFYNWYDTHDLRPLDPKYVSSVDSGNLAGHLIALGNAAREMIGSPVVGSQWLAGINDALQITRGSLRMLTDDRRTQTVTRKQLDEALDILSASLRDAPTTPTGIAERLGELAPYSHTVVDIARALGAERGDDADAGLLKWAEAMHASILSRQRDLEQLMPWASLVAGDAALVVAASADRHASLEQELTSIFDSIPTLADLPDRCETAIRVLARYCSGRDSQSPGAADSQARAHALTDAFKRSANAARSLRKRFEALGEADEEDVPSDGIRLPLRPSAPAPVNRLPGRGERSRSQLLRPARL